jgi:C-terminal processing protease CtpA/Prc
MEQCIGMLNLDTDGRLGKKKLLVLGAGSAGEWIHIFRGTGYVTGFDVATVNEELDASDHKSFHEAGVPAVQLFSGPHLDYHRPSDTFDKIDAEGLLKVASVAKEVIEYLAGREESMMATLTSGKKAATAAKKSHKVSLGTIPDFAYSGEGFLISGVVQGSPAESGGLKAGDVIVKIGSRAVQDLKGLSDILKTLNPGDTIAITFLREGKQMTAETKVVER